MNEDSKNQKVIKKTDEYIIVECKRCDGSGRVWEHCVPPFSYLYGKVQCEKCQGNGCVKMCVKDLIEL